MLQASRNTGSLATSKNLTANKGRPTLNFSDETAQGRNSDCQETE